MDQATIDSLILPRVRRLLEHYQKGDIPLPLEHEVHPDLPLDSRDNYLYFTLPVCINFQRSSPAMWRSALETYEDPETRYIFYPEQLANTPLEKVRFDMVKHKLALQPSKHVLIWTTIARSLHEFYNDDPRKILEESNYDAKLLIGNLQTVNRKRFPYLSGPKLSNYWPFILSRFTDATFKNAQEISIIPDTHVIQSSVKLGLVSPSASSLKVEAVWRDVLTGSGIDPTTMHPVLWHWSRNNFIPEV